MFKFFNLSFLKVHSMNIAVTVLGEIPKQIHKTTLNGLLKQFFDNSNEIGQCDLVAFLARLSLPGEAARGDSSSTCPPSPPSSLAVGRGWWRVASSILSLKFGAHWSKFRMAFKWLIIWHFICKKTLDGSGLCVRNLTLLMPSVPYFQGSSARASKVLIL